MLILNDNSCQILYILTREMKSELVNSVTSKLTAAYLKCLNCFPEWTSVLNIAASSLYKCPNDSGWALAGLGASEIKKKIQWTQCTNSTHPTALTNGCACRTSGNIWVNFDNVRALEHIDCLTSNNLVNLGTWTKTPIKDDMARWYYQPRSPKITSSKRYH